MYLTLHGGYPGAMGADLGADAGIYGQESASSDGETHCSAYHFQHCDTHTHTSTGIQKSAYFDIAVIESSVFRIGLH